LLLQIFENPDYAGFSARGKLVKATYKSPLFEIFQTTATGWISDLAFTSMVFCLLDDIVSNSVLLLVLS